LLIKSSSKNHSPTFFREDFQPVGGVTLLAPCLLLVGIACLLIKWLKTTFVFDAGWSIF